MSRSLTWLLAGAALSTAAGGALAAPAKPKADPKAEIRPWTKELPRGSIIIGGPDGENRVFVMRHGGDRAERLTTLLQLRPEQEPALKAYLEALKPQRDHLVKFEKSVEHRASTTERLAQMEARLAEQQAAGRARIDATRAFYGQLDARQKKVFDEMPMMFMGPGLGPMPMGPMPVMHRMHMPDLDGLFDEDFEFELESPGV
jgi:hypothetical protein